jgi:hypothetical protein
MTDIDIDILAHNDIIEQLASSLYGYSGNNDVEEEDVEEEDVEEDDVEEEDVLEEEPTTMQSAPNVNPYYNYSQLLSDGSNSTTWNTSIIYNRRNRYRFVIDDDIEFGGYYISNRILSTHQLAYSYILNDGRIEYVYYKDSRNTIAKFKPKIKLILWTTASKVDNEECPVCYNETPRLDMVLCNCAHKYCYNCIYTMITKNTNNKFITCPLCRASIDTCGTYNDKLSVKLGSI